MRKKFQVKSKILKQLSGKKYFVVVDESTAIEEKAIFDIFVGKLDGFEAGDSFLIASFEVSEIMDGKSIAKFIDEKLSS
jgi:hypothetical protein